jgi:hypothetical protein
MKRMEKMADDVTPKGIKVAVCVPSHDMLPAYFSYDLAGMIGYTTQHFTGPGAIEEIALHMVKGTYVHTARQELLVAALQGGADYVLFLDSDMRFPKDTIARLLSHKKSMVGTNYPRRGVPPEYVAIKRSVALGEDGERVEGELLQTTDESTGLEEVEALGFGCVLVHRSVFGAMGQVHDPREKGPFWFFEYHPEIKTHIGEDVFFCRLAREVGTTIYVDHDLSKDIRHIGQMEYALDHTWAFYAHEEELLDGSDNELRDAPDGDSGRAEQVRSDDEASGVRPERRIEVVKG